MALSGLEATTTSEPVEHSNSDGDVVIRVVRDLPEMQEISFDAEILPELPPEMESNDESPMPPPIDTSPPLAFTTEVVTPNDKWLSSFELPKQVYKNYANQFFHI
jgi:hypothetical protein